VVWHDRPQRISRLELHTSEQPISLMAILVGSAVPVSHLGAPVDVARHHRPQRVPRLVVHPAHQARRVVPPQVPCSAGGVSACREGRHTTSSGCCAVAGMLCQRLSRWGCSASNRSKRLALPPAVPTIRHGCCMFRLSMKRSAPHPDAASHGKRARLEEFFCVHRECHWRSRPRSAFGEAAVAASSSGVWYSSSEMPAATSWQTCVCQVLES